MIGDKEFDCKEMFRHACSFYNCAEITLKKFEQDTEAICYVLPIGVNFAFASEVFLKCILKHNGISYDKEHELIKLFNLLPEDIKNPIQNFLELGYSGFSKEYVKIKYFDNINKAFVNWRYAYERDFSKCKTMDFQIGFLITFSDILREVCCTRLFGRSWEEYSKGEK